MNTLAFGFAEALGTNGHQVRPLVDGADLLRLIAGLEEPDFPEDWLGLDPPDFFRQPQLILGGRLFIGRCECGELGCGSVVVKVVRNGNAVTWRLDDQRKYEFNLAEYLETIERAEGMARRIRLRQVLKLAVWLAGLLLVTLVLGGLIWTVAVAPLRY